MDLLNNFHSHFVNPSVLRLEPKTFGSLAALPDNRPLSRVSLACWAYMVPEESYVRCGPYFLALGVTEGRIKEVVKKIVSIGEEFA